MKKVLKFNLLVLPLLLFASCSSGYKPTKEMSDFLNGLSGKKAFESISSGHYSEVYQSFINDEILGTKRKEIYFDYKDNNYYYYQLMTYDGNQINNDVVKSQALMCLIGEEYHIFTRYGNQDINDITITHDEAKNGITNLIYINENNYDGGGLYYGDIFKIYSTQFPNESFYIENEKLYFDEKYLNFEKVNDSDKIETIQITQKIGINKYGLLTEAYEKVQIESTGEGGINTLIPEYDVDFDKKSSLN